MQLLDNPKALSRIVAKDILIFLYYFLEKLRLGINHLIHMTCQALFSMKNRKIKMLTAAVVNSTLGDFISENPLKLFSLQGFRLGVYLVVYRP